jgi:Pou domain - N-terminal to homeobox domain
MGKMYCNDFSQTTISRFEALNLVTVFQDFFFATSPYTLDE